ncbi:hypothetical protein AgCh_030392 [Apium graveolens]
MQSNHKAPSKKKTYPKKASNVACEPMQSITLPHVHEGSQGGIFSSASQPARVSNHHLGFSELEFKASVGGVLKIHERHQLNEERSFSNNYAEKRSEFEAKAILKLYRILLASRGQVNRLILTSRTQDTAKRRIVRNFPEC